MGGKRRRSGSNGISGAVLRRLGLALLTIAMLALVRPAWADHAATPAVPAQTADAKMQALLDLLADPDIQARLTPRRAGVEAPAETAPARTMALSLADHLQVLRNHFQALAGATGTLPDETVRARTMVTSALDQRGWWTMSLFFIGFLALGFGAEWAFRWALRPAMGWLLKLNLESVNERVRAVFARLGFGLGILVFFALGSVGAFLLFDWPALVKEILLGYLMAFLAVRLCMVLGRFLLAPGAPRFRVVPISTEAARFLHRRWALLAALLGFGWQTIGVFDRFGLPVLSAELLADAVGLLLLLVGLDIVWRTPRTTLDSTASEVERFSRRHRSGLSAAASVLLLALWSLWVLQATLAFWLLAFGMALPVTIMVARRSVNHILRPPGLAVSVGDSQTLDVIVFERGIRTLIIVGAALVLGRILGVDFVSLTMQDTAATHLIRGAISVVIIALAADFLWHVIKALIDRKLATNMLREGTEDAGHAARLQTLLPIVSNILLVVIVVVAGMMMLSAAGVEIGPLIASAGVVGVAIGFGAQTLVKDIISGIFYLFDDAFRVGEYIQSGSFKGTVESFSLRSVKLRHQRGALYTVPFGILGAVQNQSRDWVVDKIVLNVPYGTDLEKVRKLIKKIGETLLEDPEIGADIINPLKMQGVVQFGDFAIQIQTKMMTKPGDAQFVGRRRALLMINRAFAENGIGFAIPMVHVAGNGGEAAAAARQTYEMMQAVKAD